MILSVTSVLPVVNTLFKFNHGFRGEHGLFTDWFNKICDFIRDIRGIRGKYGFRYLVAESLILFDVKIIIFPKPPEKIQIIDSPIVFTDVGIYFSYFFFR